MSSSNDKLTINSTVTLSTGHKMPLLGFGVFQNQDAKPSVIEAFKAGYRCMLTFTCGFFVVIYFLLGSKTCRFGTGIQERGAGRRSVSRVGVGQGRGVH
jgi:hypothetical protein